MADQAANPKDPWLTRTAVNQLNRYLKRDMLGFEWGSGRSTVWFANRLGHLVSVEHDAGWHVETTKLLIANRLHNVDYRLVPQSAEQRYASQIEEFPDEHFDFILIDGEDRDGCVRAAATKVRAGGLIVVDNAESGYDFGPLGVFDIQQTSNGVWRTDIFTRRL
jgi:predicted O-methyltransferase YrrM